MPSAGCERSRRGSGGDADARGCIWVGCAADRHTQRLRLSRRAARPNRRLQAVPFRLYRTTLPGAITACCVIILTPAFKPAPKDHAGRTNDMCQGCHKPAAQAGQTVTPTVTGSTPEPTASTCRHTGNPSLPDRSRQLPDVPWLWRWSTDRPNRSCRPHQRHVPGVP